MSTHLENLALDVQDAHHFIEEHGDSYRAIMKWDNSSEFEAGLICGIKAAMRALYKSLDDGDDVWVIRAKTEEIAEMIDQ